MSVLIHLHLYYSIKFTMSPISKDKHNNICALLSEGLSLTVVAKRCHANHKIQQVKYTKYCINTKQL
jgi:hypothetical protein